MYCLSYCTQVVFQYFWNLHPKTWNSALHIVVNRAGLNTPLAWSDIAQNKIKKMHLSPRSKGWWVALKVLNYFTFRKNCKVRLTTAVTTLPVGFSPQQHLQAVPKHGASVW